MPGRLLRPGELIPDPGAGKSAAIPRELNRDGIVRSANGQPGFIKIMKIGQRRHHWRRTTEIEGTGLARDHRPPARGARTQRICHRIETTVHRDCASAGSDLETPLQQIRAEGRVMTPHHVYGSRAHHAQFLGNQDAVAVNRDDPLHLHRHGEEASREAKGAGTCFTCPGSDRRFAMKAMEYAVDGAGITAIGKQQRPATSIARQPLGLVMRGKAADRICDGIPWHLSQHRKPGVTVNDIRDGSAHPRTDGDPDRIRLDRDGSMRMAHLMAPAMSPRINCFWKTM